MSELKCLTRSLFLIFSYLDIEQQINYSAVDIARREREGEEEKKNCTNTYTTQMFSIRNQSIFILIRGSIASRSKLTN